MLAHELRVQDRVMFAPPVPMVELVQVASEADLGVAPFLPVCLNTRFCLPNKLFEYMMAGLAIVATDVPEMRKIVLGHGVGLMFPSDDPKEMAAVCNELLGDKSRLLQMKKNSALAATQIYNWEQEERRLLQAYTALA
jgi:glycosyltransferase involved in cell wall biosynthesis